MGIKKKFIRVTLWLGCGSKFETEGHDVASALVDAVNAAPFEVRREIKKRLEVNVDSWAQKERQGGAE
jgi:methylphosphotriester-DNA--protein-cysteine methyltransferase